MTISITWTDLEIILASTSHAVTIQSISHSYFDLFQNLGSHKSDSSHVFIFGFHEAISIRKTSLDYETRPRSQVHRRQGIRGIKESDTFCKRVWARRGGHSGWTAPMHYSYELIMSREFSLHPIIGKICMREIKLKFKAHPPSINMMYISHQIKI